MSTENEDTSLATKYRPGTLDRIIGHGKAVTVLKGVVASGKIPGVIAFMGPTSVGKTTLARAFAADVNGKPVAQQGQDYFEADIGSQRSIDDIREFQRYSKFQPTLKRRFIVLDEAQAVLSNQPAATALLKSLEGSGTTKTTWILCSMEPDKFKSTSNGKAILNRCNVQVVLEPHTNLDLFKQGMRIVKGERMDYVDKEVVKKLVVKAAGGEMRGVANALQSLQSYWAGLAEKPEVLTDEDIDEVAKIAASPDDALVVPVIVGVLTGKFAQVQRNLIDVKDGFQFINKCLWASQFLLNNAVLQGERHPKVWWTPVNKQIMKALSESKPTLGQLAALSATMIEVKSKAGAFAVGETELLSLHFYKLIKELKA